MRLLVACLLVSVALPRSLGASYSVTGYGYVKCGGTPLRNVRIRLVDDDVFRDDIMATGRSDNNGRFSLTGRGGDFGWGSSKKPDVYIKVEYDYIGKMRVQNAIGYLRYDRSSKKKNTAGNINFGTLTFNSEHCKAYWMFREAILDYHQRSQNSRLPYSYLKVQTRSFLTAGAPYATTNKIRIPKGYPLNVVTAKHELAHTIRHTLDGSFWHFLGDVARHKYMQHHSCSKKTNLGFAFNEGWAEYWAGSCRSYTGTDYAIEGNVASALRKLSALACHSGRGPAHMVDVLEANRGRIHSFADFKARHDAKYPSC